MAYIGKIHIMINGEDQIAKITEGGMAILPSGEEIKLSEKQFALVKEKIEEAKKVLAETEPMTAPPQEDAPQQETPAEEKKDEPAAEAEEQKVRATDIVGKHEAENFKKDKKKKKGGKAAKVWAVIFALLFIAETAAVGVGYEMGYIEVNIPGITDNVEGGYIETDNGEITNIQPSV